MRLNENENSNMAVADMLIDEINKRWENVRGLNSTIVTLKEEKDYKDIIPVIEQILEDEHSNIGQLEQLIELIAPKADNIESGKEETIDILDSEDIDLEMNENYSNAPKNMSAMTNTTYLMANEEHDENEKKAKSALKANEKNALSTVPKEGSTGKKVKSPELKKMHLSESLFDE